VRRLRLIVRATLESGPRATLLALRAKRRGAKQKLREFAALIRMLRRERPRVVLEIGTFRGGTLWAWCRLAAPDATIISVDLPGGDFGGGYESPQELQAYRSSGQSLHLIRGDSHSLATLKKVTSLLDGRAVDFACIDGDHTYDGVKQDFEMYGSARLVAFHDTLPHNAEGCEVDRLWRELEPRFQTREIADPSDVRWDGAWGGIGVLYRKSESPAPSSSLRRCDVTPSSATTVT
jgi:hypothetical protein